MFARSGHVASEKISNMNQNRGLAFVILARWRTVMVAFALAAMCLIPAVWFSLTPEYEVTATVHVAPVVKPVLVTDLDTDISRQYRDYLTTQANIIASPGCRRRWSQEIRPLRESSAER